MMVETYYPFDAGAGSDSMEAEWTLMARNWIPTGVIPGELNELECYGDSTGMQVKLKSGRAWLYGHFYESDAEQTLAITAANGANPRLDRVILELDLTNNVIDAKVIDGTAAATPSPPSLTQTAAIWQISLAMVRVETAIGTIAKDKVLNERRWARPPNLEGEYSGEYVTPATYRWYIPASQDSEMAMGGLYCQGRHLGLQGGWAPSLPISQGPDAGWAVGYYEADISSTIYRLYGDEMGNAIGGYWYEVFAAKQNNGIRIQLVPFIRVNGDAAQVVTPSRHNAAATGADHNWADDSLNGAKFVVLTGAKRGEVREITDSALNAGGNSNFTYGGADLALAQGVWLMLGPPTEPNHYLGAVFNDNAGNLISTHMVGKLTHKAIGVTGTPAYTGAGQVALTALDLSVQVPPTAREILLQLECVPNTAGNRFDVSWDGTNVAASLHGQVLTKSTSNHPMLPLNNTNNTPTIWHKSNSTLDTNIVWAKGWRE